MKTNNLSRIVVILMLVLMGSAQAMAQGDKLKKVSYAKSGDLLQGEQLYVRTSSEVTWERGHGYAPAPWIIYVENGGSVDFKLPNFEQFGEFSDYGSNKGTSLSGDVLSGLKPDFYSFSYYLQDENEKEKEKRERFIDVMVVPYAVPYLGKLRLQGAISNDSVHLEKTVSEEDFFTYTIKSDSSLMQFIKINPQGGYDIDGNLGIHAALTQRFPESGYKYAIRLSSEQERLFADGVSVKSLKDMAVLQGLNPNDFVLQIGIDNAEGASIFSEVYRDQARLTKKTTFLRIIDKRQKYYTLKASSNDLALGTVEPATLTVKAGGEVSFTATAKENAIFKGWKKGSAEVSVTELVLKLTNVQEASEWTAVFEKKEFEVKASSNDLALGTVEPAELKVKAGGEVSFTATAKENAIFKGWKKGSAEVSVTELVLKLTNVQEASEWTAVFEKKEFEVKASSNDLALGTVEPATLTVKAGGEATFTATAKENAIFKGWKKGSAEVSVTGSVLKLTNVQEASEWTAVFEKKEFEVKASSNDLALGTVEPATLTVKAGGEATFTATAKENAIFKGWKKGSAEVSVTELVLKLTNVQEASEWTAVFEKKEFEVKASSNDLALGTVEPAELKVKAGGEVTFTATAKENAIFKGWKKGSAEVSVTELVLKLTNVQEASEWTAVFEKKAEEKYYTLKASSNDLALGTVEPAELKVKAGGEVSFTATAKENAIFKGWKKGSAEVSVTELVLKLTNVQEASEWTAVFEKKAEEKYYTLKASSNDLALGTVEPAELKVKAGGEVSFTATAKENAIFKGWKKGSAEVSVTELVLKLTNVQEASEWTAVFEKKAEEKYYTLKASSNDLALGTVEPAELKVKAGGEVTFTATAKENAIFKGWKKGSAEVSVTELVLKLTNVQEASEWTAVFEKKAEEKYYTLKASSNDLALGTVEPAELKVKAGGEVSFTATAKENAIFKGWKKGSAEVSVTELVLKLTNVQEASEWTAVFEKKAEEKYYTLKASSNDLALGTVEPAELKVKAGGEVSFTATAKENAIFKGWKKGSAEVSVTELVLKLTNVQEASEWTAVFEKKASTPEVGAVDLQFGQREAILTWAPGSATSWQIKLYRSDTKLVKTILTQLPRVELESLVPGEVYRYELVAKRQGKLDSQVKQGTFKTDQFNEREALAPYLKNFSKLLRGKAFDLIWMDVNLSEFYQETPIYEYYWQLNETSPKVLLIPDGKQLTLDTNQVGGCLIILIKSGDTLLYEVRYELDK